MECGFCLQGENKVLLTFNKNGKYATHEIATQGISNPSFAQFPRLVFPRFPRIQGENLKKRTRKWKKERKHALGQGTGQENDQEKKKVFYLFFLLERVFSSFLTFLFSFINSHLWTMHVSNDTWAILYINIWLKDLQWHRSKIERENNIENRK